MNLADPSPGLGWRGLERRAMPDRGKPDLVLALALVHHVAISANVPVKEFIDWLASLGTALVIEFPTREDPMVKKLLAPKRDGLHPDYELGYFERTLAEAFEIERSERLGRARGCCTSPARSGDDRGRSRPSAEPAALARDAVWAYLGIAVLWTFAVAQPLFDLLKDNPEFFAARGSSGFDVISWSVLLVVLPPALLLAIELLIGLAGAGRAGRPPGPDRRAGHADRRAGAEEVDRASDPVLIVLSLRSGRAWRRCSRAPSRCARSCACCRRRR